MNVKHYLNAAHIEAVVVATLIVTIVSAFYGASANQLLIVFFAVLTGQLSIGLHNNYVDVESDKLSGRKDKAVVNGLVSRRLVFNLALGCLGLTIVLSLLLGYKTGLIHLSAVLIAWVYNFILKKTTFSVVCYFVAFSLIPLFSASLVDASPAVLTMISFGFFGTTMHFVDALGDFDLDNKVGTKGFTNVFPLKVEKGLFAISVGSFILFTLLSVIL